MSRSFFMLGLSHKSAAVELREALALDEGRLKQAYADLAGQAGIDELVLLSTCNRVEAYVHGEDVERAAARLQDHLAELAGPRAAQARKALRLLEGDEALLHLMQVATSLDSMVLGETQILGQVKAAYEAAVKAGAVSGLFHGLFQKVFAAAKEVRSKTEIGRHAASVPSIAVKLAERVFSDLKGHRALVLGAGDMAELTAEHLKSAGVEQLDFCNRSLPKAKDLARRFHGQAHGLDQLEACLAAADVVLCSTGAPSHVVGAAMVEKAAEARQGRSQLLIDLSVPRNIDPAVAFIEEAFLYNLDDLSQLAEEHREKRVKASQAAELILRHRLRELREWLGAERVTPTVASLGARFEGIRQAELERQKKKFEHLSEEDLARIDYLTQALTKKLLDTPIRRLKQSASQGGKPAELVESLETLFDLKDEDA